ncbi:MAG: nucleotidyltransferase family protein [Bacteroidales bacterium]|nr:nucleotidyltransferase family protein [Bacteroidales bacterium]
MMITDINKKIRQYLRMQPVRRAYLFGSFSRDEDRDNSDIDILLELEEGVDLFDFISIKLQLEKILNKKVDLVSENGVSPRVRPYIENDKVLIYEKTNIRS